MSGWIGFDLDGTLAHYNSGKFRADEVGEPIAPIVQLARRYMARGNEIRIFTARVYPINACIDALSSDIQLDIWMMQLRRQAPELMKERITEAFTTVKAIRKWSELHLGRVVSVTNVKDYNMTVLYDDRARQVLTNQGIVVGE